VAEVVPNYELVRARLIKTRQKTGLSLRQIADQTELSAATLSRFLTAQSTPDIPTLSRLADWLDLDEAAVFHAPKRRNADTPGLVEAHLRADKNLDPQTAEALAKGFRELYRTFAKDAPK
jgi:transcriptional regulator with XRE-family HTH domain